MRAHNVQLRDKIGIHLTSLVKSVALRMPADGIFVVIPPWCRMLLADAVGEYQNVVTALNALTEGIAAEV